MSIRIIPTNSIRTVLAYWLKCTCCCQSRGRQVKDFRKAWRTACRKADISISDLQLGVKDGRVFHDLRRTTARNLNRAGVPDRIAMGLMGHKTRAMYGRYNIVDEEDIRHSMQQMEQYLAQAGDNPVTENPKG